MSANQAAAAAGTPSERLHAALREAGLDFFLSVPCKLAAELIALLEEDGGIVYSPVSREEEGVGIMAGAWLAGRRPALVMQNSGFGNSVNAVCSLLGYYGIPAVFLMTHRGSEGEPIRAQDAMGRAVPELMEASGVDAYEIGSPERLGELRAGIARAFETRRPAGFLFPFAFWREASR